MQIDVGSIIAGKYRIERPLARGGMGSVWVARHVKLGSRLAVKFLDPRFAATPAFIERFEREARAAAALESPHVVQVRDYGVEEDVPYLVMELLDGEDLGARLARQGRLSLPDTARILKQIGKALRKAHDAGIVHRDLKPANLFVTRVDDEEVIKVLDFGIAKETASATGEATKTGEVMGSPHYMSPEQASAEKGVDHRADLWSLGVILYRTVTGVLPFPGEAIGAVLRRILLDPVPPVAIAAPDLPASLDAFFAKALAKPKEQRFQSVRELIDAFVVISGGVPLGASGSVTLATSAPAAIHPRPSDLGGTNVTTLPLPTRGVLPFATPEPDAPPAVPPGPSPEVSASTLTTANASGEAPQGHSRSAAVPATVALLVLVIGGGGVLGWSALRSASSHSDADPAALQAVAELPGATPPSPSVRGEATGAGMTPASVTTTETSASTTTSQIPTTEPVVTADEGPQSPHPRTTATATIASTPPRPAPDPTAKAPGPTAKAPTTAAPVKRPPPKKPDFGLDD